MIKRVQYRQACDGDWIEPTPQRGHKMRCCDCGLIHRINFRVVRGRVQFQAWRDARATAAARRPKKGSA